ncbi:MAG: response regulator [Anaerolineae bacterium]|nr:response regulator [Anaerolineae bacterium]
MSANSTILVVEDDISLRQGICDILEIKGYSVLTAGTGREGLDVMLGNGAPPDLIVSDIMMPVMDGYQFFSEVRKEPRWMKIPFIFLTAKGEKADIRAGKMLGAEDYIVKPFEPEDLVVVVSSRLRRVDEINAVQSAEIGGIKRGILTILNHEFRTPLTYIVAYADMLNRDPDELSYDEMKMFLTGINTGADRLRRLIENFILLVELQTGEAQSTFNWRKRKINDYDEILRHTVEYMTPAAEEKGVKLQAHYSYGSLPSIIGDTEYLRTALIRLVDNAIKFSDKSGAAIYLAAEVRDSFLCFDVEDQGRGIPPDEQQTIFDLFYQINRQVYEDQGAGSGLPIVDRIAKMHGGGVTLQSEPGVGSRFTLYVPLAEAPANA